MNDKPVDINMLKLRVHHQITLKEQRDLLKRQKEELERAPARVKQLEDLTLVTNRSKIRSAKILIVDDDEMNRELLRLMLSKHFDNLLLACNGQEGLELLANNCDVDLILLDLVMPVMGGKEMLAAIKKRPNLKSIAVIIASGNREDALSTLVIGADDFIAKPFDQLELSIRVTHHLQKKFESSERPQTEQKLQAITNSAQDDILMIVPICMYCQKIRDDQQSWHQLEENISYHSEVLFSHGMCPDCAEAQMEIIRNN